MSTERKFPKYGWKPSLPDYRDIKYSVAAPIALPSKVDLRPNMPAIYNQLQTGSCTGNGIAGAIEYNLIKDGKTDFMPSRLFIYWNERVLEGTTSTDSGAMIRDGMKAIKAWGVCHEDKWPFNEDAVTKKPTDEAFIEALLELISNYRYIDNSNINNIKQALANGLPVIFGFSVYSSFESEFVAQTGKMSLPTPNDTLVGGHCVDCVGYDDEMEAAICRNSWGPGWGDQGYFYMPYNYITNTRLASDFWVINAV